MMVAALASAQHMQHAGSLSSMALAPYQGCRCHTCFAFCLWRSLRKIQKRQILEPNEENASCHLSC